MNIPNLISIFRILLVPVIIWLLAAKRFDEALILFFIAAISDGLDGALARLLKQQTKLGAYLDPIADKALLVSIYIVLGMHGIIPLWVVIAVVFRDILIVCGTVFLFILGREVTIQPLKVSKLNTFLQLALVIYLLIQLSIGIHVPYVIPYLYWLVGMTTIVSGAAYLSIWLSRLNNKQEL